MTQVIECPRCQQLFEFVAIERPSGRPIGANGHHGPPVGHPSSPTAAKRRVDQLVAEKRQAAQQKDRALDKRAAVNNGQVCPDHGVARPSRFGGLYCPQPAATASGWCDWEPDKKGAA